MPLVDEIVKNVRVLSVDMIERAKSGHPGLPLGAAPIGVSIFNNHLRFNPNNPDWINRDRFVLSAGHGSALLYSLLHIYGYDLSMDDLKQFRQMDSKTPGHPELGRTPGVDTSTGPLGQGIATAVGMAMAEAHLASIYNKKVFSIIDHYTYCLLGDGCLMEGISSEAVSLAGHLGLGKLIVLYDSNHVSLDGGTDRAFSENVLDKAAACGWQVQTVEDGNDVEGIDDAILKAKSERLKPSIIKVNTTIGYGTSQALAGTHKVHGNPIGEKEEQILYKNLKWHLSPFELAPEVAVLGEKYQNIGKNIEQQWLTVLNDYQEAYPDLYRELMKNIAQDTTALNQLTYFPAGQQISTRNASGNVLNQLTKRMPNLFGGSADLSSSNKTYLEDEGDFQKGHYSGKNIWFGVREFSMGAILNGIVLHGGLRPFGATFFAFSDYMRPAIRLAALMKLPVIYVLTHDSITVGEDGPTHQPIEQLASFRAMPGLNVIRPADGNETLNAYKYALSNHDKPTMLVLSRQGLPIITSEDVDISKGAYVLQGTENVDYDLTLVATGSEVSLALKVANYLKNKLSVRVVSMPCRELFEKQQISYQTSVILQDHLSIGLEMASSFGWGDIVDKVISIDTYGLSGKPEDLIQRFGFTEEEVAAKIEDIWQGEQK